MLMEHMDFTVLNFHNPNSDAKLSGLILLRADADALGLDISECLAFEKTNPSRAYIDLKMIVGKRISNCSSSCELFALYALWDKICIAQTKAVQKKNILRFLGSQKHSSSSQCTNNH